MSAYTILVIGAFVLAILALVKPSWPLTPVAVVLLCVAALIGR